MRSNANEYDANINKLKKYYNRLKKSIDMSNLSEVQFLKNEIPRTILNIMANKLKLMFSDYKLNKIDTSDGHYYSNEQISIDGYWINKDDIYLVYDKKNDVFKIRLKLNIFSQGLKSTNESNYMDVIITKIGRSLNDIKKP